ncbi:MULTISPECIES: hypothetical protein [Streptomyces]|uniref:Secreted protein n=1 Tax=Streptomyces nodosus TaxID=40318 RepID=A0A0B5DJV5_9ACTN|nr:MULTISPECIES: hypothetical protein [Streptomyces]AJE40751.1 hypothetical protein SNOD_12325 [Streptomyces nodosus]MBB4791820.1 hypothetical protein [Streptomyces nodosus]MYV50319.1 hypothetical protein [Streptomyces sp. SID2888]QEV39302.1 hypothetical protein CP978_12645 [Streptomyces nodosus]
MKPLKAAAVLAGSLAVAGIAAPAFADDASGTASTGLNGALGTMTGQKKIDVRHLTHRTGGLDTENKNSVLGTVKTATTSLNRQGGTARLLGGLPVRGR